MRKLVSLFLISCIGHIAYAETPFVISVVDVPITANQPMAPAPHIEKTIPIQVVTPISNRATQGNIPSNDTTRTALQSNCGHSTSAPTTYSKEVLCLQIFLDRNNFSGGSIDGVWGRTTQDAMQSWQATQNLPITKWVDPGLYAKIAIMEAPTTIYSIAKDDLASVTGPTPMTWTEKADLALMGYATIGECLAERFHTSERTLRKLNPTITNWERDLVEGLSLNVPNVKNWPKATVTRIEIDLNTYRLRAYTDDGKLALWVPCSIAKLKTFLPNEVELKVTIMAEAPNYTYDPATFGHDPSIGKIILNPGPRNPVGTQWIGLNQPGYGIHGTPSPHTVGRPESRGCFRLANWNIDKLFSMVTIGMPVKLIMPTSVE